MKLRPDRVASAEERLDQAGHSRATYERSLDRVAAVNRWLGGDRALWKALRPRLPRSGTVRILDTGTGSAEVPRLLARRLRRVGLDPCIAAVDMHSDAVRLAAARTRGNEAIRVVRADAVRLPFRDGAFDFGLLTLTLHHLDDAGQIAALSELGRVARTLIVGELERAWPNYFGARLLAATLWRSDPITRHDGPLSVLRAFTADELLAIAAAAGLRAPRVQRRFYHRLLLIADAPTRGREP